MTSRRLLLAAAGAALSLSRHGLAADPAAPWAAAPAVEHPDWRVRAAHWAVLAPNPHNRQPWLLEWDGPDAALLRADLTRLLPVTDPADRQVTVGLGCFLELFRMAAAEEGIALEVTRFPEGVPANRLDARPLARIARASGTAAPDPLFAHAAARRSAKRPYDMARPVGADAIAALRRAAGLGIHCDGTEEAGRVAALRDVTMRAGLIEVRDPEAHGESVRLMRFGQAAVSANPDGIPFWGPGIEEMVARGVLSRETIAAPDRPAFPMMVDRYRAMMEATPAFIWLVTPGGTAADALDAGRAWLRVNLAATGLGLGVHPLSQALQEFPAMAGPFAEAHAMLGAAALARVQMLARLGHMNGPAPGPTPRWPAATRIRAGV